MRFIYARNAEGEISMPCIMPEMPYCPACEYGHITASENNPDTDCNWECLCTDENIKWFNEPEPPEVSE